MLNRLCFTAKLIEMSISFEARDSIVNVSVIYKMNFDWGMKISLREGLRFVS